MAAPQSRSKQEDLPERHPQATAAQPTTVVWDWPLRIWHWVFAASLTGSLMTGLSGDIALMGWHMRLGYCALGLLLFRVGWAVWGGRYARLASFRPSPARFLSHFRGRGGNGPSPAPRTAPGAALALAMVAAVAAQAVTGLYTTDEIFNEGPMVRHARDATVDAMSALHHRLPWVVMTLVATHLLAHLIYAVKRDPTPLSMFTGRKRVAAEPVRHLVVRGVVTATAAAAAVWWGLRLM